MRRRFRLILCRLALLASSGVAQAQERKAGDSNEADWAQGEEETVLVKGVQAPLVPASPEVATTVFQDEELHQPGLDAPRLVARSPGVQVNRTGSSADVSTVSIRGSAAAQVPVYLAGVRINDDVVGITDLSRVPLWMLQRAEVHRSAAPLHAARSSMSGALVFEPTLPSVDSLRIKALAGSFGTGALQAGLALAHPTGDTGVTGATSFSARRDGALNDFTYYDDRGTAFDSADDARATRQNADFVQDDLWLISRMRIPAGRDAASVTFFANGLRREQGVTGLSLIPAEAARSALGHGLFGLSVIVPLGSANFPISFSASSGLLLTRLQTTDPLSEINLGAEAVDQQSQRVSQHFKWEAEPVKSWTPALSLQMESSQIQTDSSVAGSGSDAIETEQVGVRASEFYVSAVVSSELRVTDFWMIRGEARASCLSSQGGISSLLASMPEDQFSEANDCLPEARVGTYVEPTQGFALRAMLLRAVRFPTLGEKFGVSASVRGNSALEVEQAYSGDVGARFEASSQRISYWFDSSFFVRYADQLIAYQRSALGYVRPRNVGKARFLGLEAAGEITAWNHLRLRSGLTLIEARNTNEALPTFVGHLTIPYVSPVTSANELEIFRASRGCMISRLGFSVYGTYRSSRNADPAGLLRIPAQFVVDVALRMELKTRLEVQVRVENLLGTEQFDTIGFPLPGRSAFLSSEFVFE